MKMLLEVVLFLLLSRCSRVESTLLTTNIDIEEPSVIRSPATSDPSDGFGWAAIFHEREPVLEGDSMEMSLAKTRVIIGAPKGTYPGGLPLDDPLLPRAERSGLVYDCPLGPGECNGIVGNRSLYTGSGVHANITNHVIPRPVADFFPSGVAEGRLFDQAPSTQWYTTTLNLFDRKTGQLMGSFLASNGDHVVGCASKWTFSNLEPYPASQPRGICFVGNRDLQDFMTAYPCSGRGSSDTSIRGTGYCSAGFSGVLLEDSTLSLSAVGDNSFSGSVYTSRLGVTSFSGVNVNDGAETPDSLFFGFQIAAGHVRSNEQETMAQDLAISAPRHDNSGYLGNIFIFSAGTTPVHQTQFPDIRGTQASEFFGHSLALVDLTGDGYDELVVGAPMYTAITPLMPERGRIYVFFNQMGSFDVNSPVILEGREAYGRFGFSVANAGDLNGDGREDFVVGAPRETMLQSENTGAVYVYYGADTSSAFETQEPQRISASDVVNSVSSLDSLNFFGFTLAGSRDVDKNNHDDILVGAPFSQAVVLLRSLPFANVTLTLTSSVEEVNVDEDPSFTITVTAEYTSLATLDDFRVNFTLQEVLRDDVSDPRLFFAPNDANVLEFNGELDFSGTNSATVPVPVYASTVISQLDDFQLRADLLDISRDLSPVTGQQTVTSLNMFPRLRQQGDNMISVRVVDPCGEDGCMSDVELSTPTTAPIELVAGSQNAEELVLNFMNRGSEDARSVFLVISQIRTEIFSAVSIGIDGSVPASCTPSQFETDESLAMANCSVISRLTSGQMGTAELTFTRREFIGNEEDFSINLDIIVGDSGDVDTSNNRVTVQFLVESQSGIGLELEFDSEIVEYSMEPVTNIETIGNLGSLVSLTATVGNTGPSVIQEARLVIDFPTRITDITGSNYFLYPSSLGTINDVSNTVVNCTQMGLNPDSFPANINPNRRKRRSLPMSSASRRASREVKMRAAATGLRRKRQAMADVLLDCSTSSSCVQFTCDIERLTKSGVRIVLDSYIDGRFFGSSARNRTFGLTARGEVSTLTDFQRNDDQNLEDNIGMVSITLAPERLVEERDGLFIHAIIWPIIGGVIIFIGVVILLYFVGFFRRKKKPGDDEIEGDFDAPPNVEKSLKVPAPDEATTV